MSEILMKCGHTAQGKQADGQPVCVICVGIRPGATEIEDKLPELAGRFSRCKYFGSVGKKKEPCRDIKQSSYSLPFFEHRPDSEYDSHYCGCWGWN